MAAGVISVAFPCGPRIPPDPYVCGFDDVPFAQHISPQLGTVRQRKL